MTNWWTASHYLVATTMMTTKMRLAFGHDSAVGICFAFSCITSRRNQTHTSIRIALMVAVYFCANGSKKPTCPLLSIGSSLIWSKHLRGQTKKTQQNGARGQVLIGNSREIPTAGAQMHKCMKCTKCSKCTKCTKCMKCTTNAGVNALSC